MTGGSKKGLGKGLSALMAEDYSNVAEEGAVNGLQLLPVGELNPGRFQPRRHFDATALAELAASIRKNGIMQPLVVRRSAADRYEIIAGERRWRAAKAAGLNEVPVILREIGDHQALELALIENIQREDLGPLEEAVGYQRLIEEYDYTQEALSAAVGKSRSHVANLLRLNGLPEAVKRHLESGELTMGHARALLGAADSETLALEIIRRGLNVRQTEALCRDDGQPKKGKPSGPRNVAVNGRSAKDPDILALEETLSDNLGLRVSIEDEGQKGRLILSYESLAQLDEILKRLGGAL